MSTNSGRYVIVFAVTILVASEIFASRSLVAAATTVTALAKETHFHGIAVDPSDSSRVYLATHNGLYAIAPDGSADKISTTTDDFMGFTPHPADPAILYASGHPAGGGNLGFIASTDGGKSWAKLADGVGGPVDFHQMDVSAADPNVIYGVSGGLQRSGDGGRTWSIVGPAPEGLIDLAASGKEANTLYAATQGGLLKSTDGGASWTIAHVIKRPATMVEVTGQGDVYAFIFGTGLVRADDGEANWRLVSNDFGGAYVLHLAAGPKENGKLCAVTVNPETHGQTVVMSDDSGATWVSLGGN
jgi:photosystem II stability/assembly factor-like uncharacterized protein